MSKKHLYLIIDTETACEIPHQIPYDIGYILIDRKGTVYEKGNYLVKETIADLTTMARAFYASKFIGYLEMLEHGEITMKTLAEIFTEIIKIIDKYNETAEIFFAGYNAPFDKRALENASEWLYENREWLNRDVKIFDIWTVACDTLYGKDFIKKARENGWVTEKGNIKTSAEIGYRYIANKADFEEEHRGLQDCEIEAEILKAVFATHKKIDGTPRAFPMRAVWKLEKEMIGE